MKLNYSNKSVRIYYSIKDFFDILNSRDNISLPFIFLFLHAMAPDWSLDYWLINKLFF